MAEGQSGAAPALHKAGQSGFVVERLKWASRPMGLLLLVLWVLHPSTANQTDYLHMALVGFLVGVGYGFVVYGSKLRIYMSLSSYSQRFKPNRVPDEYYWGNVAQVMFDNN
ncbi:MAG: hypothetical protein DI585_02325 [Pseudomonas fluorescens]|nr:MAG: hypothetical protein DI585_02325 [Pseudomonas fluorescens]